MRRQRGLAAITAILIVAVAASAATLMLAQQSAMLDQTMLIASRAQADQYARAGLDWARGVLLEDAATSGAYDSLDEGWAQPIAALPVERAVVSGSIVDEQGKFNLNNLVAGGAPSKPDVDAFKALLASQGLAPELADAVIDWIDPNDDLVSVAGAESGYYLALKRPYRAANLPLVQVDELYRVRGFDAATVRKLRPYVTALRERTPVNVNTASEVVLAAILPAMPREELAALVKARAAKPVKSRDAIGAWSKNIPQSALAQLDVKSAWFMVRIRVTQDDAELGTEALVHRPAADKGAPAIIWRRPRY